jgi:hypothetical protein
MNIQQQNQVNASQFAKQWTQNQYIDKKTQNQNPLFSIHQTTKLDTTNNQLGCKIQ